MRSPLLLIRILFAANVALLKATIRRLLLGATLPSWTWRTEWAVASTRRVIAVAADDKQNPWLTTIGLRFRMPLPPTVVGAVRIQPGFLGPGLGDHYERVGSTRDVPEILYFHGGGYVFGNPATHREHIARLVQRTGASVTAPPYRLAPNHRFPAAVDDAFDSYKALLGTGIPPGRLIIAGDSAGAGLAIATIHRARSEGLPLPSGLILFSAYVDLDHTSYTLTTNAGTDYLPMREMSTPNDWYADVEDQTNPEASPIRADLSGFPPMLLLVGGAEMLLADSLRFSENARRDGVECQVVIEPEMPHVWPVLAPWEPASRRALRACAEWIPTVVS